MSRIFKTKGIVFRSTKYGETSLILDIYTQEKGLRSFIVSGVRRPKAKMPASIFQHLNIIDLVAYDKIEKLGRIKECSINHIYKNIPFDLRRSSVGIFILEVARNSILEQEINLGLFDFLHGFLLDLDSMESTLVAHVPIKFLLEMSRHLGFFPMTNFSKINKYFDLQAGRFTDNPHGKYTSDAKVSEGVHTYLCTPLKKLPSIARPLRNLIIDDLWVYYRLHIEGIRHIKSLDVLRDVF